MKKSAEGVAKGVFQLMQKLKGRCKSAQKRFFLRKNQVLSGFLSQLFTVHNLVVPCCFSVQERFCRYLKRVVLLWAGWGLTAGAASGACQRCVFENVGSLWAVLPPLNQQRANSVPA
jgi:hypothetical protein